MTVSLVLYRVQVNTCNLGPAAHPYSLPLPSTALDRIPKASRLVVYKSSAVCNADDFQDGGIRILYVRKDGHHNKVKVPQQYTVVKPGIVQRGGWGGGGSLLQ